MANYYAEARSNYFRVKDGEAFREWVEGIEGLRIFEKCSEGLFGIYSADPDGGGWPQCRFDDDGETDEIDLIEELAEHLADGEVAVLMEAGNEKLQYLSGYATAVNSSGDIETVDISDIYEKARRLSDGRPVTRAEY